MLKLSGVFFNIYIAPWGHALECITIGNNETQIRGHVEPLSLNKTMQLMGDLIRYDLGTIKDGGYIY
jgi:hypothetical protein